MMRKIFPSILLGCSLFSMTSCSSLSGNVGGFDLSYISTGLKAFEASEGFSEKDEYFLGRGVSAVIFGRNKAYPSARVNQYVNRVGATLVAVSDRPETYGGYHFQVLDSKDINAMAAPGGFVFITRGLLEILPDEEALAAVLAHEVAHVTFGHGRKAVQTGKFVDVFTDAAAHEAAKRGGTVTRAALSAANMADALGANVNGVVDTLLNKGYSRSQEYDADEYAVQLMTRAGYDPNGLLAVLRKLEEMEQAGASSGGSFPHPSAEDRIDEVEDEIENAAISAESKQLRAQRFERELRSLG